MLLIFAVSLLVYYPSLFSPLLTLDDESMVLAIQNTRNIDLKSLFFPSSDFGYYRPLIWLSFLVDRILWDNTPSFMHMHNMILHALNGVIVFLILRILFTKFSLLGRSYAPLFGALLFILHPVNSEAVNWVSARTDLLAGFFVFTSFLMLVSKGLRSAMWSISAAVLFFFGILSKESAIVLLPFVAFFLLMLPDSAHERSASKRILTIVPFLLATASYILMRPGISQKAEGALSTAYKAAGELSALDAFFTSLAAFGFYLKKLVIPFPLSFAILEIATPIYLIIGTVCLAAGCYLLGRKRDLPALFLVWSFIFILPALPVAISRIAWTPFAERYLYMSSFGVAALSAYVVFRIGIHRVTLQLFILLLLAASAYTTYSRSLIWQSNLSLYEDSVRKAPRFLAVRNEYAVALFRAGRAEESIQQLEIARGLPVWKEGAPQHHLINRVLFRYSSERQSLDPVLELENILLSAANDKQRDAVITAILSVLGAQAMKESDDRKLSLLYRRQLHYMLQLSSLQRNGAYHYKLGQLYLALKDSESARSHFLQASELEKNTLLGESARKISAKIKNDHPR